MSATTDILTETGHGWELGHFATGYDSPIASVIIPAVDVHLLTDEAIGRQVKLLALDAVNFAAEVILSERDEYLNVNEITLKMYRDYFIHYTGENPEINELVRLIKQKTTELRNNKQRRPLLLSPEDYEQHSGRSFVEDYIQRPILREWAKELRQCAYRGVFGADTIDHIVPRYLGGTDDPHNLIDCCRSCNSKKGPRTPEQAGMPILYDDRGF